MKQAVRLGRRAVVIGGSMAGLAAARALADHFEEVVILERDAISQCVGPRKSVPQGRHIHALLASGHRAASALFPDFTDRLLRAGAIRYRVGVETSYHFPEGSAFTLFGKWRDPCDTGIDVYSQSRALVEHVVRQCTAALGNVTIRPGLEATGLTLASGRVRGVRCAEVGAPPGSARPLEAELVVDASGRRASAQRWIAGLGYALPAETAIGVKFAYASARFRIRAGAAGAARSVLVVSPHFSTGGVAQEIEDRTWIVSLGARFGTVPPTDEAGFLGFARALHSPRIHQLLAGAERLEDIASYRYPTSVWRHFDQLRSFPSGLLLLGDAMCSFNPIWGQGMTIALLQAVVLKQLLAARSASADGDSLERLGPKFYRKAARVIRTPWSLAADLDLSYPQTEGVRPPGIGWRLRYSAALDALAHTDPSLTRLLYEVYHLLQPPSALTAPSVAGRALLRMGLDALGRTRR